MREFEGWALKELGNAFGIAGLKVFTPGPAPTTSPPPCPPPWTPTHPRPPPPPKRAAGRLAFPKKYSYSDKNFPRS